MGEEEKKVCIRGFQGVEKLHMVVVKGRKPAAKNPMKMQFQQCMSGKMTSVELASPLHPPKPEEVKHKAHPNPELVEEKKPMAAEEQVTVKCVSFELSKLAEWSNAVVLKKDLVEKKPPEGKAAEKGTEEEAEVEITAGDGGGGFKEKKEEEENKEEGVGGGGGRAEEEGRAPYTVTAVASGKNMFYSDYPSDYHGYPPPLQLFYPDHPSDHHGYPPPPPPPPQSQLLYSDYPSDQHEWTTQLFSDENPDACSVM